MFATTLALASGASLDFMTKYNVTTNPTQCLEGCRTDSEGKGGVRGSLMNSQHLMNHKEADWEQCAKDGECGVELPALARQNCVNGRAGNFPCQGLDLMSFVPFSRLGCVGNSNDIWGWTRAGVVDVGNEIAIHCCTSGTSFVDISDPENPVVLGYLPGNGAPTAWRDAKVYENRVYITSESTNHGVQVLDMRGLPSREEALRFPSVNQLRPTFLYVEHGSSHNININVDTGYAYSIGSRTCRGGLHIIDVKTNPDRPQYVTCFADDGYTHDVECMVYNGPDQQYNGREICFAYNENSLTIVDVTDKQAIRMVSRTEYPTSQYTHQGWLNEARTHLLMNDELDEQRNSFPEAPRTRTLVWNVESLSAPRWERSSTFIHRDNSIDHNLYILGNEAYLSNYCAGLRVLDISQLTPGAVNPRLTETHWFDVSPTCNTAVFRGTWSNYPYFASKNIVVTDIGTGLFVVRKSGTQ